MHYIQIFLKSYITIVWRTDLHLSHYPQNNSVQLKHQGTPCSQRCFNFSFDFSLASGYENMYDYLFQCSALSHSLRKNRSNH